jgi:hypothetical protein
MMTINENAKSSKQSRDDMLVKEIATRATNGKIGENRGQTNKWGFKRDIFENITPRTCQSHSKIRLVIWPKAGQKREFIKSLLV